MERDDPMELPKRKQNRLSHYDYSQNGAYFITVCTANRNKILWNPVGADTIRPKTVPLSNIGKIVEQGILQMADHYQNVAVDHYCIMPDHMHLILRIAADADGRMISAPTVSVIVGQMKRWVSKEVGYSVWQKSFIDRVIRNESGYRAAWNYIESNPYVFDEKQ